MMLFKPYDRQRAVAYAETWALYRNPLFLNFAGRGGDCTNFTSQCLLAGCCTMNFTKDFGWYYRSSEDRAPAWTSVVYFYDFLTGQPAFAAENGGGGPFGREVGEEELQPGDFIQLADGAGDYYHTLIVTGFEEDDILVCAHTDDALNRPLSTYGYASLRYLHVDGVGLQVPDDSCYLPLLEGRALVGIDPAGEQVSPLSPSSERPHDPILPEEGEDTPQTP